MASQSKPNYAQLMKAASDKISLLEKELAQVKALSYEPIAIIGIGCRFPGGVETPEAFWQLLRKGMEAITPVPASRWSYSDYYDPEPGQAGKTYTYQGGFLKGPIDEFDPAFFGISPRETEGLDPQQRLLLEVSWEALEHAGQSPDQLIDSRTGVFVGICTDDYAELCRETSAQSTDAYYGLGITRSVAVGRISFLLGLQGPNVQLDTACSSSLVTVHLACQSLRSGESDLALAGGVNLILSPTSTIGRCQLKALSPDGRCKTFDASADGYGQGEGCGILVLKRLSDAIRDSDQILAVVRGSAVNHDGKSSGLTVPNGRAQEKVIRQALENCQLSATQVSYIEAHGTGTSLGDPIELGALDTIFGLSQARQDHPLIVGSVKTNIGHLEGAAGVSSLIKVALMMKYGEIPPHLNFKTPNPYIPWDSLSVTIPTEVMPWPTWATPQIAGVSSFGISGTNAHIILEAAPLQPTSVSDLVRPLHLFTLSAKSAKALKQLANQFEIHLKTSETIDPIEHICFTTATGRSHFNHRLAIPTSSKPHLINSLAAFSRTSDDPTVISGVIQQAPDTIAFLFTGQGSQYGGMGQELYNTQPTFKQALDHCAQILDCYLDHSLLEVLYSNQDQDLLGQTVYTQPALFALEYSLCQLWMSWGLQPDLLMGHSVGEYVAACIAGVFSLEDGLKLITTRAKLMQDLPANGAMVSVMVNAETVKTALASHTEWVAIAAFNGPESTVISGEAQAIAGITQELEDQGYKTKALEVSQAFHSPLMDPILQQFEHVAQQIEYAEPEIPLVSNVTGQLIEADIASAQYWVKHVRQPVQFAQGMATLQQQEVEIYLEIGPKPVLLGMGRQCLVEDQSLWLPSLRQGRSDWEQMLDSLAQLHISGVKINWQGFDRDYPRHKVTSLPTYPFQRQRYWVESPPPHQTATVQTEIVNLLDQSHIQALIDCIAQSDHFTAEQLETIHRAFEQLTHHHQLQLQALRPATIESPHQWLYHPSWQLVAQTSDLRTADLNGHWLIFADQNGIGVQIARQLRQQGASCYLVYWGDQYQSLSNNQEWQIRLSEPQDYDLICQLESSWKGAIHLWSLDSATPESLSLNSLHQAQKLGCGSVLNLVQALVKSDQTHLNLRLVTQSSQVVQELEANLQVQQSSLWGLGRVIALEHPEFNCQLIDLEATETTTANESGIQALWQAIITHDAERQVAYRGQQRYGLRLKSLDSLDIEPKSFSINETSSYLITGGLGSLGLEVSQWMVAQGAKHLVLMSRHLPNPEVQSLIDQWSQTGVQVQVAQGDVSSELDLQQIMAKIERSMPPLKGIVHTAGVLDDGMLIQQNWQRFENVLAAKVWGSWNLHQQTQSLNLDFCIYYSSTASLLGSPGQGNYAAANAFMDGLAHYRQQHTQPAISINWGPWSEVGMAARLKDQAQSRLALGGMGSINRNQGLELLGQFLQAPQAQIAVLPMDQTIFSQAYEATSLGPLLEILTPNQVSKATDVDQPEITEWTADSLPTYIKNLIAKSLKFKAADAFDLQIPLTELGVDSLIAGELRNQIIRDTNIVLPIPRFVDGTSANGIIELAMANFSPVEDEAESEEFIL